MEIYISTDVEADGPIPGPSSMLSFASAAFRLDLPTSTFEQLGTFSRNLEELDGATPDPRTLAWWKSNEAAYRATRVDKVSPASALRDYVKWLGELERPPQGPRARVVFVGYPVTYDFMFVYWYLMKFVGSSPFSHSALDIKTLAMTRLRVGFRDVSKRSMPRRWFGSTRHSHVALDDAIEQGELFCRIMLDRE